MRVEQIYTKCLAQGAYYVESNGEAAIIDPLRDPRPYIELAENANAKIKYVFETHIHADFVSGHLDLATKTGATIVFGSEAKTKYNCYKAVDGEIFKIGRIKIKIIHTPGHTLESVTYLLIDERGKNHAIFSGDTLFLGDVGIPDVAQQYKDLSKEKLAEMLYDSLREKIMPLSDKIIIYPGHGAGSACGKNLSKKTVGTLGEQKKTNYALRSNMTKDEFVSEILDGIGKPPQYFKENIILNKSGCNAFDKVLKNGNKPLRLDEFERLMSEKGVLVLDVRTQKEFIESHISGSMFIGLDGNFAPWVGALISNISQPIILVVPEGRSTEAVMRLARVGYDNTLGYLKGGIEEWKNSDKPWSKIPSITANELENAIKNNPPKILDVRKKSEFSKMHLMGEFVENIPLSDISSKIKSIDLKKEFYIHCASGYRSVIAASILKAKGIENVVDIKGGFQSIKQTNVAVQTGTCN